MNTRNYLQLYISEEQRCQLETLSKKLSTKVSTLARTILFNSLGYIHEPHLYKAFKQLKQKRK